MKRFHFLALFVVYFFVSFYSERLVAGEQSTYNFSWLDPDKEVYVLQNRKYRKVGKAHVVAGYGQTLSGPFVNASSIQGRAGYFIVEDWGFELLYAKNSGKENETAQAVRNPGGAGSAPFRRLVNNYMGGMVLWSPFYAKVNTFNTILYVDWMVGAGYGKLEETNNRDEVISGSTSNIPTTETHNGILWGTALKFYYNQYLHVRWDLTGIHYQAQRAKINDTDKTKAWYNNYDMTLSLGVNF